MLVYEKGIFCVVYAVDDTIRAGADSAVLEEEIRQLGVSETAEQQHTFQLRNEGEVPDHEGWSAHLSVGAIRSDYESVGNCQHGGL